MVHISQFEPITFPSPKDHGALSEWDRPTILFVDDDASVLSAIKRLLRHEPFDVLTTTSPQRAIEWVKKFAIAVIVSDYRMPKMMGIPLLKRVKEQSPHTVRMVLTGYADLDVTMAAINDVGVFRLLSKPWDEKDLRDGIYGAIEKYRYITSKAMATSPAPEVCDLPMITVSDRLPDKVPHLPDALPLPHQEATQAPVRHIAGEQEPVVIFYDTDCESFTAPLISKRLWEDADRAYTTIQSGGGRNNNHRGSPRINKLV